MSTDTTTDTTTEATPDQTPDAWDADAALVPVTTAIAAVESAATIETVALAMARVDRIKRAAREAAELLERVLFDWVQANGPLQIGPVRYYVGPVKKVKCRDVRQTLQAFLGESDIDTLAECLSASAFKHGACEKLAPTVFADHFDVTYEEELKEGKPERVKKLQRADDRFQR